MQRRRFLQLIGGALGVAALAPIDSGLRAGRLTEAEVLARYEIPTGRAFVEVPVRTRGAVIADPDALTSRVQFDYANRTWTVIDGSSMTIPELYDQLKREWRRGLGPLLTNLS